MIWIGCLFLLTYIFLSLSFIKDKEPDFDICEECKELKKEVVSKSIHIDFNNRIKNYDNSTNTIFVNKTYRKSLKTTAILLHEFGHHLHLKKTQSKNMKIIARLVFPVVFLLLLYFFYLLFHTLIPCIFLSALTHYFALGLIFPCASYFCFTLYLEIKANNNAFRLLANMCINKKQKKYMKTILLMSFGSHLSNCCFYLTLAFLTLINIVG